MVRAKFVVNSISVSEHDREQYSIKMTPVYGGSPENEEFFRWTPAGNISIDVVRKETAEMFKVGQSYYVDFSEAESVS